MLRYLSAGESHGPRLTAIIEGMPAGLRLTEQDLNRDLLRRQQGYGRGKRMRIESDRALITSGVMKDITTGAPIALQIENRDWPNWKDREVPTWTTPRPGHADLSGAVKYGIDDLRIVAERASARETATRVAVGAVAKRLLDHVGIRVGSAVVEIGGISSDTMEASASLIGEDTWEQIWLRAEESPVRCPDAEVTEGICRRIDRAKEEGDSLGGIFVVAATGIPVGLGSYVHWDRRLDARLAQAVMSIPAIKGVEIGSAFENAGLPGTQVHDEIFTVSDVEPAPGPSTKTWQRRTNRAGGLEGGITNGEPLVIRAAMKPIPTTVSPLRTMDLHTGEATTTTYRRSDVCAVPAAAVVSEAMVAWVLACALIEKLGGDHMEELEKRAWDLVWPQSSSLAGASRYG